MDKVVVTGIGVASPFGCDLDSFWAGLVEGRSGVVPLPDEQFGDLPTRIGALVTKYDPGDYFNVKELRRMSRSSHLAVVAASQAIADAGLLETSVSRVGVAVIIGSSIGGYSASDPLFRDFYLHGKYGPLVIPVSMNVGPASNVSLRFKFQGPLMNVDAACASAAHSIGYSYNLIRTGQAEIAVTGGADCPFSRGVMAGWCALHTLSVRNERPAEACRPFSADRDGMVLGEGAGVLVLESEASALRRGRHILGEVKGYGATSDGYHVTQPATESRSRAMSLALRDARLTPDQIDYINAHGTGTVLNDRSETAAIKSVFGTHAYDVPVVSNKGAIGHAMAASGALELIGCLLSLRYQRLPPTINWRVPDPDCDLDYVTQGSRARSMHNIMSNSFALGGSNAVLIVGTYQPAK